MARRAPRRSCGCTRNLQAAETGCNNWGEGERNKLTLRQRVAMCGGVEHTLHFLWIKCRGMRDA